MVQCERPKTLADGLRGRLGDLTWPIVRDFVDDIITVSEREIIDAMQLCFERMKVGSHVHARELSCRRLPASLAVLQQQSCFLLTHIAHMQVLSSGAKCNHVTWGRYLKGASHGDHMSFECLHDQHDVLDMWAAVTRPCSESAGLACSWWLSPVVQWAWQQHSRSPSGHSQDYRASRSALSSAAAMWI